MFGARLTILTLGLATSLATSAVRAADYYQPSPQPVYIQPPPVIEEFGSAWYLRGDVGIGMMRSDQMEYIQNPATPPNDFKIETSSIGNAFFVGGGVGYEFNNWLRFDGTAEYRSKAPVYAFGSYVAACNNPIVGGSCIDTYQGYVSSWVFLANAYIDLGTWNCFTPFVGAGFGAALNTLSDFTDVNVPTGGRGLGRNTSEWHPAWALHAGVAYNVSKTLKVELAYRYLDLGSVSDTIVCVGGGGSSCDTYKFNRLTSQDIKLGLRWTCCDFAPPPPRYVYTPPPPDYTPPPPLRSKG